MLDMVWARLTASYLEFRDREEGQALVEYALILSLVSIAAIVVLGVIGTRVNTVLGSVRDAL
jgi:pilus assembly protein Flp/PilA